MGALHKCVGGGGGVVCVWCDEGLEELVGGRLQPTSAALLSFFFCLLFPTDNMSTSTVLVYGGKGALGATIVSHFIKAGWVSTNAIHTHALHTSTLTLALSRMHTHTCTHTPSIRTNKYRIQRRIFHI